jgi:ribosomal protein L10
VERAEKTELVATLNKVFNDAGVVVVSHNMGITVAQMNDLRAKMAEAGATVKVAKNRLAKLALDGTDAAGIKDLFVGPTMVAYAADSSLQRLLGTIDDPEFSRFFFGIWLDPRTQKPDLRSALLGGSERAD